MTYFLPRSIMDERPISWLEELPHTLDYPTYLRIKRSPQNDNAKKDLHRAVQVMKQAAEMLQQGESHWRVAHVINGFLAKHEGEQND